MCFALCYTLQLYRTPFMTPSSVASCSATTGSCTHSTCFNNANTWRFSNYSTLPDLVSCTLQASALAPICCPQCAPCCDPQYQLDFQTSLKPGDFADREDNKMSHVAAATDWQTVIKLFYELGSNTDRYGGGAACTPAVRMLPF